MFFLLPQVAFRGLFEGRHALLRGHVVTTSLPREGRKLAPGVCLPRRCPQNALNHPCAEALLGPAQPPGPPLVPELGLSYPGRESPLWVTKL